MGMWALYQYVSGSVSVGLGFAPNFRVFVFCYREIGSCDSGHRVYGTNQMIHDAAPTRAVMNKKS